jgi:Tol biopolymer transport system component/DNA-binding winged helix-turn-helix (wHTH) protein
MNRDSRAVYEFGGFRLDPRRRVLTGADGAAIALKPKTFDTLLYFVEHAGEELDKGALLAGIWPNVVVEENNLNKSVSELRRVLGETPDDHRFIVTVPGRGYRFVAHVSTIEPPNPASSTARSGAAPDTSAPRDSRVARPAALSYVTGTLTAGFVLVSTALYLAHVSLGASIPARAPAQPSPSPATRFVIDTAPTLNPLNLVLSPDGRKIAYVGEMPPGSAIFVRALDSVEARMLPGTEGVTETAYPFWSRDGRFIAYRSGTELKRVDVETGATSVITAGIYGYRRGAWGADGTILAATSEVIQRFSASGGDGAPITTVDDSLGELCHSAPSFLPDGKHFLYKATNANRRNGAIYVASLDPSEPRKRLLEASRAVYVEPGYLVFARERTLFAQRFDPKRLELVGAPVQLADDVVYREIIDSSAFDAARGTLIYRRQPATNASAPLTWVDLSGRDAAPPGSSAPGGPTAASIPAVDFELSPDGRHVVFADGISPDVWTLDLERGTRMRLTSAPEVDHNAVWSPDGTALAFDSHRAGRRQIFEKRADGAVPERVLYDAGSHDVRLTDWSPDGRFLVFERDSHVGGDYDIWLLPLAGGDAFAYRPTDFDERAAKLSPDGRWMAYVTSESGVYEVVVQSFPDPAVRRMQISANGGYAPRWARDGAELYYYDLAGAIVRVSLTADAAIKSAERVAAAPAPYQWGVTADGARLLALALTRDDRGVGGQRGKDFPIYVTLEWDSAIPRR